MESGVILQQPSPKRKRKTTNDANSDLSLDMKEEIKDSISNFFGAS